MSTGKTIMNNLEKQMAETLNDLKLNHHITGVKAEFETEGASFEEALRLKKIATEFGLDFTIKIGGCGAVKDMREAELIGANVIVAPMIESPYAAKKYVQTFKTVFSEEKRKNMKFLINIETKYGIQYLEEILGADYAHDIDGIVFGRTDMTDSLNLSYNCADSKIIFDFAQKAAELAKKNNKKFLIGGAVTIDSLPFFRKLPYESVSGFETRKIVFNSEAVNDTNIKDGIIKALRFEILWIKNKNNYYGKLSQEDSRRIEILESRAKNQISNII